MPRDLYCKYEIKFSVNILLISFFYAIVPVPDTLDKSECGTSLYEIWRKQELNKYPPPNPAGAAIGGVIVGIIILAIFLVWDRRNHDKKSGDVSMFERF